jgi:alpha-amylase/alpha-mannosidase (GH57 family)
VRYICVHGHFYQPPRENAWLEVVETQDSAAPYHDWNERITAECYRPNAWSRVVDKAGFITEIRNNYSRISFDFGPTLLRWLESRAPDVYGAVLKADRESQERFSGHGSAIAQAYHHQILPLAQSRDRRTQIRWGVRDFARRFGRPPEGMWLPETAVDNETLGLLAEEGLRFTILAPNQARRYRHRGASEWTEADAGGIRTTRAYEFRGPTADRSIAVFFYDGPTSHALAFGGLLHDGPTFANRLGAGFSSDLPDEEGQLSHIATDGETYGHHHRLGDMALAFALQMIERDGPAKLTNYGEFLARHPPEWEVEIKENTSWSCAHGVERWRSSCGCNSLVHPGWQQEWRGPLRAALDWLRDTLTPKYEARIGAFVTDPWAARDDYVDLVGERSPERVDRFLEEHRRRPLTEAEVVTVLELLELQRHLQQMYTSCGWFFDDLGGIETVQVLRYASRAVQLAEHLFGEPFEEEFKRRLAPARGNVPTDGDGAAIYDRSIASNRVDLQGVCVHYALSSLFEEYEERAHLFCYEVDRLERELLVLGAARLAVGQASVASELTRERARFTYGALHIGGYNLYGGVRRFLGADAYAASIGALKAAFERGDIPESIRLVDQHFGTGTYSLRFLFGDEQRRIVGRMLESTRIGVENSFRQIYESTAPALRYLGFSNSAAPRSLSAVTEFFLNMEAQHALEREPPEPAQAASWLAELGRMRLPTDAPALGFAWSRAAERVMEKLAAHPEDVATLHLLTDLTELLEGYPLEADLARVQNQYYELLHRPLGSVRMESEGGEEAAASWWADFRALGERLKVRVH